MLASCLLKWTIGAMKFLLIILALVVLTPNNARAFMGPVSVKSGKRMLGEKVTPCRNIFMNTTLQACLQFHSDEGQFVPLCFRQKRSSSSLYRLPELCPFNSHSMPHNWSLVLRHEAVNWQARPYTDWRALWVDPLAENLHFIAGYPGSAPHMWRSTRTRLQQPRGGHVGTGEQRREMKQNWRAERKLASNTGRA